MRCSRGITVTVPSASTRVPPVGSGKDGVSFQAGVPSRAGPEVVAHGVKVAIGRGGDRAERALAELQALPPATGPEVF